ncbi:MAG: tyrosine-protein phosphatase [Dehalococcoidia bacterium]
MTVERHLDWDGCYNVRDLGGLATIDGRRTRRGAVVRADGLDRLTTIGWAALRAHGIRTVIDLRNDDEIVSMPDTAPRPTDLTTIHVPLDDSADTEFWQYCWSNALDGTPLYYQLFLDRKPERCAAAVRAVARAEPGGVVFHCGAGRDRTGLVSLLLLALVGVVSEEIAADYDMSTPRLHPMWAARGMEDQGPMIEAVLARRNTTTRALLLDILASLDADAYLCAGSVSDGDLDAIHARLLDI